MTTSGLIASFLLVQVLILGVSAQLVENINWSYFPVNWSLVPSNPPSQSNEPSTTFGDCICNLLFNQCTPNCCCDPDCSSADFLTFTQCNMEESRNLEDYSCVSPNTIEFQNLPANIQEKSWNNVKTAPHPFCVYYETNTIQGTFYEVLPDFTTTDIQSAIQAYDGSNYRKVIRFDEEYTKTATEKTNSILTYVYGNPILISDLIYVGGNAAVALRPINNLLLPSSVFSEKCEDNVVAGFLQEIELSSCFKLIDNLSEACNTYLNASLWTTSLLIARTPSITTDIIDYVYVNLRSITKTNGAILNYLPITQFNSNTCLNSLSSIQYYISYSSDGIIQGVDVDIILEDFSYKTEDTLYQMSFGISFIENNSPDALISGIVRKKSGNPGYIKSLPVIAGLTTSNLTKNAVMQSVNGIEFYTGLSCNGSQIVTVNFGEDLVTACMIQMTLAELEYACELNEFAPLQEVEASVNVVGRFGNANFNNINDWVKINTLSPPTPTWDPNTLTCQNIASGLQYDMIMVKTSSKYNEQWKIGGVQRYRFGQNWQFTSNDPNTPQPFWIQFRAIFTPLVDQEANIKPSKIPNLLPTLPEDIFYPFTLFAGAPSSSIEISSILATILTILYIVL
jgi:tectonic-1/3